MRIYVTGMGAVSCLGHGVEAHRCAFRKGRSGIVRFEDRRHGLPAEGYGGLVADVDENGAVPRGPAMLAMAVCEAWSQAGLPPRRRVPLVVGSTHGNIDLWQQTRSEGHWLSSAELWSVECEALRACLPEPEVTVFSTACTASAVAVQQACRMLKAGWADVAVAAGYEVLTSFVHAGFTALRSLSRKVCRPFDRDRDGLTLGEGAAAVVLESEDHLQRRGAEPLAEVLGWGFAIDGVSLTAPDPGGSGAAEALAEALNMTGNDEELPAFINLHGTGTLHNDRMEGRAVERVFGNAASEVPLTATKPFTGHMCGAAGVIELVATIVALRDGHVPPVLGLKEVDPEIAGLSFITSPLSLERGRMAVTMNSGFGGTNTAICIRDCRS